MRSGVSVDACISPLPRERACKRNDEDPRGFADAEPEDEQGEESKGRNGSEQLDQRIEGQFDCSYARHEDAERDPGDGRDREAGARTKEADYQRDDKVAALNEPPQLGRDEPRGCDQPRVRAWAVSVRRPMPSSMICDGRRPKTFTTPAVRDSTAVRPESTHCGRSSAA